MTDPGTLMTDRDYHPNARAILAMMPISVKHLERDFLPIGPSNGRM